MDFQIDDDITRSIGRTPLVRLTRIPEACGSRARAVLARVP